jgi:hypothetical protein
LSGYDRHNAGDACDQSENLFSYPSFPESPHSVKRIRIDRNYMVAELHILEQICIPLLDCLPSLDGSSVRYIDPVLREARGGIVLVHRIGMLCDNVEKLLRNCGSGVSVCWAKLNTEKLIAKPTRSRRKRIFIISSGC